MTQRIGLPHLPRRLAEHTGKSAPKYRVCYDAAVEGRIPAEFFNGRWSVIEADLDAIADAMGMAPAKSATKALRKIPVSAAA